MHSDCLVIVPAFNEEKNISNVIQDLLLRQDGMDILVVDDGSHDKTAQIAQKLGIKVVTHPFNLGYGAALQTGFKYALAGQYNYVIQFDGDGQHIAGEIDKLVRAMKEDTYDIVIGSRFMEDSTYNPGILRKIGIRIFRFCAYILTMQKFHDPTSGFQMLSKKVFSYYAKMKNYPNDYPDVDVLINMRLSGCKIAEVPVQMKYREEGKSIHHGFRVIIYVFKMITSIIAVLFRGKRSFFEVPS